MSLWVSCKQGLMTLPLSSTLFTSSMKYDTIYLTINTPLTYLCMFIHQFMSLFMLLYNKHKGTNNSITDDILS